MIVLFSFLYVKLWIDSIYLLFLLLLKFYFVLFFGRNDDMIKIPHPWSYPDMVLHQKVSIIPGSNQTEYCLLKQNHRTRSSTMEQIFEVRFYPLPTNFFDNSIRRIFGTKLYFPRCIVQKSELIWEKLNLLMWQASWWNQVQLACHLD